MAEQAKKSKTLEEIRTQIMAVDRCVREEMGIRSHKLPIFQSTTWEFDDPHTMEEAFAGHKLLDIYGPFSSPNYRAAEAKIAILEEGEAAQICASGHMAIYATLMSLTQPGQFIIAHKELYGGTYPILDLLSKEGRFVEFADMRNIAEFSRVLCEHREHTAAIFFETPSNPSLHVIDIAQVTGLAKECGKDTFVIVDNTFATSFNQRPLTLGADVVLQSMTKYLDGHGINFGGAAIASKEIVDRLYPMMSFAPVAPYVAWQFSESILDFLQTMPFHNQNAWHIAHFLAGHRAVKKVYYPGLPNHDNHAVACAQMRALDEGMPYGGMVSFELHGAKRDAESFIKNLRKQKSVITHAVSLGNRDSLIAIPSCGIHAKGGHVPDNLIRFSVGIEDYLRLQSDIDNALAATFPLHF